MKAKEFKDLADKLQTLQLSHCNEGRNRTIISRYYYYLFLRIRNEIIFSHQPQKKTNIEWTSSHTHSLIRKYIRQVAKASRQLYLTEDEKQQIMDIATFLDQLHEQRKNADYETDLTITIQDVQKAIAKVTEIEARLPVLENTLTALKKIGALP